MSKSLQTQILLLVASFAILALLYGSLKFAAFITIAILWHELGHIWAMKRCGLSIRGVYFIPLIGAAAVSNNSTSSSFERFFIAVMGPVAGLLSAVPMFLLYFLTGSSYFAAAAGFIALFNLLPVFPLDGGQILAAIGRSFEDRRTEAVLRMLGLVISCVLMFLFGALTIMLIILVYHMKSRRSATIAFQGTSWMSSRGRAIAILSYIGTAMILFAGFWFAQSVIGGLSSMMGFLA